MQAYDALVIGGGPAGSTAALLLARAGWSVLLMEKARFPRNKVCGEYISAPTWAILDALGMGEKLRAEAGPAVRRIGLFCGASTLATPLPAARGQEPYGRAVPRARLDALLLAEAAKAGAQVWQPCSARTLLHGQGRYLCQATDHVHHTERRCQARLVIDAHGAWTPGIGGASDCTRPAARPGDLFGFKAHFCGAQLPDELMPLLIFPGGYGGMVQTGQELVSLSCCVQRRQLEAIRRQWPGQCAGDALLAHLRLFNRGARETLANACLADDWLAAGPIRPGVRATQDAAIYRVGNAAGEAHPIIAEGISMAIQSGWLLGNLLAASEPKQQRPAHLPSQYAIEWRRDCLLRIRFSQLLACLALQPAGTRMIQRVCRMAPALLSAGARLSGK